MARQARNVEPHQVYHLAHYALAGTPLAKTDGDFQHLKALIIQEAPLHQVELHHFCLLSDHFHLLATPHTHQALARWIQAIHRKYTPWYNQKYHRSGSLWQGRFCSHLIYGGREVLAAMLLIDSHAQRSFFKHSAIGPLTNELGCEADQGTGTSSLTHSSLEFWTGHPSELRHAHQPRTPSSALKPSPAWWGLGNTPFEREHSYQNHIKACLETPQWSHDFRALAAHLRHGRPLANKDWLLQRGYDPEPPKRGRPKINRTSTELQQP